MPLIENALYTLINGKKKITSPIFIKEFEKENSQLKDLIKLSNKVSGEKKNLIDRDILLLKQGLDGEQNVYFELKNSFVPMLCLHDIRLEFNDYVAQFDFILITNKFIMVLETKKLNGDIEITSDGDFIRIIRSNIGKFIKKEGMYSPISQNERHINILREILTKEGVIKTFPIKSAVVIANPKTILNKTHCPKSIQNQLYKYDQIAALLKKELSDPKNDRNLLEKYSYEIGDYLITNNKPAAYNYSAKYSLTDEDMKTSEPMVADDAANSESSGDLNQTCESSDTADFCNSSEAYESLRKYRLAVSKEEGLKPYMVFTNEQLDSLIQNNPKTKDELIKIKGFGEKKVEKYGEAILAILHG